MNRLQDRQAQKVYAAERILSGGAFATVSDAQAYVNHVLSSEWWTVRTPTRVVSVVSVQGPACVKRGKGERWIMGLPPDKMAPYVVLHELAHILAATNSATRAQAHGHGRYYCAWYLALVREVLGEFSYKLLLDSFNSRGVEVHRRLPLPSSHGENAQEANTPA